jgi:hypothetical protein
MEQVASRSRGSDVTGYFITLKPLNSKNRRPEDY